MCVCVCVCVTQVVEQLGSLDILVNCAAGNFLATAEELSPNGFRTGTGFSCKPTKTHLPTHAHAGIDTYASVFCLWLYVCVCVCVCVMQ